MHCCFFLLLLMSALLIIFFSLLHPSFSPLFLIYFLFFSVPFSFSFSLPPKVYIHRLTPTCYVKLEQQKIAAQFVGNTFRHLEAKITNWKIQGVLWNVCASVKLKAIAEDDYRTPFALCHCHLPFILSAVPRLSVVIGCTSLRGTESFLKGICKEKCETATKERLCHEVRFNLKAA